MKLGPDDQVQYFIIIMIMMLETFVLRKIMRVSLVYYPPRDVFDINMGKYRLRCIFVYIRKVFFYSTSAYVCCIKILAEMTEMLEVKFFIFTVATAF